MKKLFAKYMLFFFTNYQIQQTHTNTFTPKSCDDGFQDL